MLAQGTPLHVVPEVLGHASTTITKDVYGHLVEGDKRSGAESMSQAPLRVCQGSERGCDLACSEVRWEVLRFMR